MRFKKSLQASPSCPSHMRIRQLIETRRKLTEQLLQIDREIESLGINLQNLDRDDDVSGGGKVMIDGEAVEV
jgi:hypothetical protein